MNTGLRVLHSSVSMYNLEATHLSHSKFLFNVCCQPVSVVEKSRKSARCCRACHNHALIWIDQPVVKQSWQPCKQWQLKVHRLSNTVSTRYPQNHFWTSEDEKRMCAACRAWHLAVAEGVHCAASTLLLVRALEQVQQVLPALFRTSFAIKKPTCTCLTLHLSDYD